MSLIDDMKQTALELGTERKYGVYWDNVIDELRLVQHVYDVIEVTRWSIIYEIVVERDGEYVRIIHESGATEMQDSSYATDELDSLTEVVPVQKTVTVFERKSS